MSVASRCRSRASSSAGWNGDEAEVVEQVVAVFEVGELAAADEQHHRDRAVGLLADVAQERPAAVGVGADVDDRARPPPAGSCSAAGSAAETAFHE